MIGVKLFAVETDPQNKNAARNGKPLHFASPVEMIVFALQNVGYARTVA
jgi:hypothetical protein